MSEYGRADTTLCHMTRARSAIVMRFPNVNHFLFFSLHNTSGTRLKLVEATCLFCGSGGGEAPVYPNAFYNFIHLQKSNPYIHADMHSKHVDCNQLYKCNHIQETCL